MEEVIVKYLSLVKDELKQNGNQRKSFKIKSILSQIGCQRRSQSLVDKFNKSLIQLGLNIEPEFDIYLPYNEKVSIYLNEASAIKTNATNIVAEKANLYSFEALQVKHDFFYYLFDFGSEQEYEMFQACLDSNKPIGVFLVPEKEDFFSDVVAKILTYEAIRKKQYIGVAAQLVTSNAEFSSVTQVNEEPGAEAVKYQEQLSQSTILHFSLQLKRAYIGINGILFFGLPGCSKTLLANAFANESGRYFFKFSPADIKSMWIGQSQKNLRDIFSQAKKKAPSVLFIDELDSIGFSRSELQAHTDQKQQSTNF